MTSNSLSDLKLVSRTATNRIIFYDSGDKPIVAIALDDQVIIDYTENVLAVVVNQSTIYRMSVNSLYDIDGKSFTPITLDGYDPAEYRLKLQEAYEWLQSTVLISCCNGGPAPSELRFYDNRSAFPSPGTSGILYVDEYTDTLYRWESPNYYRVGGSSSPEVTGIIYGGVLTAAIGGTTFDLAEGLGQIITPSSSMNGYTSDIQTVSWATQAGVTITNLTTAPFTYVLVNNMGLIVQQSTPFTDAQYKTHIIIGIVCHIDLATVNLVTNSQNIMYQTGHRLLELINSFGVIKKSGLSISPLPGTLEIGRDSGEVFKIGGNYTTSVFEPDVTSLAPVSPCNLCRVYRDGAGGYVFDTNGGSYYIDIDPTLYDDGTGTLASVGGSRWTVQRLYVFPNNPSDVICYYGIERYNNFEEARSGLEFEQFAEADITLQNAAFLGYLFVKRTATDLSLTTEARFLQSGSFRGIPSGGGGGSSSAAWGSILPGSGVSSQADLVSYLASNYYPSSNPSGFITASALLPYLTAAAAALTYVPLTRSITINGTTQDLSANRSWTIASGNVDLLEITATTSNSREDNYAPTGWPGVSTNVAKVIRLSTTNTNNVTSLGGLASGASGKIVTIVNASANGLIILENESVSSIAANRFQFNQSSTYFLLPNRTITLIYSGSRWVQFGLSPVSGLDLYDEMTNGQQAATATHVSNLFNWVTSPNTAAIRSEGAQDGELGVIGFLTGTSASVSMRAAMGTRTDNSGFVKSGAASPVLYLAKIRIPTAPSVAQDFDVHVGFMNSTTTTLATGCYWWYLPTAASGNTTWQNITSNTTGGSLSIVNSPIAASTTFALYLGLFFTGNFGDCVYIYSTDGVTYSVSSKFNWSSGTYEGKPFFGMAKTAGTTQRIFLIDSAGISYNIKR